MIAGAALQKDSQALRDSIRGNVKVSCFTCGAFYYTTAAQIRAGTHPCRCGAGPMITANLLACSQLEPCRLPEHPDLSDAEAQARRGMIVQADEWADAPGHCECGWRMPAGADPDYFYCRKCGKVNERMPDGSMGSFAAAPFSAEAEEANGRVRKVSRLAVQVGAHRERVTPLETAPDLPF